MAEAILSKSTQIDIDKRVSRILKDLGNPEPPVNHELIRELIKLDRAYFQKDDPTILSEIWSRLKRSTKQIVQRPALVADMLKTMSLRAAYVPDAKRIYIDSDLHPMKKRWGETHECIHDILPWHQDYMFGDNRHTLSHSCREKLEAEANYGTGRVLFAGNRFNSEIADLPCSLKTVTNLKKSYGNSLTSTLWRLVETTDKFPVCAYICPSDSQDGLFFEQNSGSDTHFVRSPLFLDRFSNVTESSVASIVDTYLKRSTKYFAGEKECFLTDVNGENHTFHFETINNRYSIGGHTS